MSSAFWTAVCHSFGKGVYPPTVHHFKQLVLKELFTDDLMTYIASQSMKFLHSPELPAEVCWLALSRNVRLDGCTLANFLTQIFLYLPYFSISLSLCRKYTEMGTHDIFLWILRKTECWRSAVADVPAGFSAVAGFPAVAGVPALHGVPGVDSVPVFAGIPAVCRSLCYCWRSCYCKHRFGCWRPYCCWHSYLLT